jgi:hypothetical protein
MSGVGALLTSAAMAMKARGTSLAARAAAIRLSASGR